MKKAVRIVIVLLVVLAMVMAVKRRRAAMGQTKPYGVRPVAVHVAPVVEETLERSHSYLGVVEPWQVAKVSSRISARVEQVLHWEGDRVEKGELLVTLDDSDIRAEIQALESTIQSLETNKQFWVAEDRRDSKLAKEGVITPVEAETTHNRMAEAVARLDSARNNRKTLMNKLSYTQLKSPFDGQVTIRDVDPGDLAAPGRSLMVVEDRSAFKISFDAPQEDIGFLKTGMGIRATVQGKPLDWKITRIYPSLNSARMVRVEARISPQSALHSGSFVSLELVSDRMENAVTVPRESLMQKGFDDWSVFTVADGKLHLKPVRKLMESGGRVAVQGLEAGEQVITSTFLGWANLSDGLKVEVMK